MNSREEKDQVLRSQSHGSLESPYLEEDLFVREVEWESNLAGLEAESLFWYAFEQGITSPIEPEELEEEIVEEDAQSYTEPEEEQGVYPLEETVYAQEGEGEKQVSYPIEGIYGREEAVSTVEELEYDREEAVFEEEALPMLFDAERPEPEEEVDEEAELPTNTADGWVVPQDVLRAGENQFVRYDDAPAWNESKKKSICTGRLSDGARILGRYLQDNFPGIRKIGGYNCRPNSASPHKVSIHGTGRALDIMIPTIDRRANSAVGDPIANWLVLNASAIGIQYLIWNRVRWSGGRRRKFARYTGPNPHRDHIHAELNLNGAQQRTTWFVGRAMPADIGRPSTIDYEKATRLNRFYAKRLGWQDRIREITHLLGVTSSAPEERDFVDALANWQRQKGIGVDGILGPNTWARMQSALSGTPSPDTYTEEEEKSAYPAEETAYTEEQVAIPQPALQYITHAGPYRLAYDRLTTLGVIEPLPGRNTRRFRGTAALQTALDNWAPFIQRVMLPPNYILTGGLYVNKAGEHGNGNAIDVDGFWWSDTNKFLSNDAPTDWVRYITIEATLRKVFGTVLNYDYNSAHHDHWHCDLGSPTRWRAVRSQVNFAQRALKEIWGENLAVDGKWGNLSKTAAARHGYDFSVVGEWDRFMDNIINRQSTPAAPSIPQGTSGTAKPPAELVRFVQRVLNAAEGEQLAVDGDLGRLTSGALERFRRKHNLGAGSVIDEKTQLALMQRALEEIRQQSLFGQFGVLDAATRQELFAFKSERGLRADDTLDAATRSAIADALARSVRVPSTTAPVVTPSGYDIRRLQPKWSRPGNTGHWLEGGIHIKGVMPIVIPQGTTEPSDVIMAVIAAVETSTYDDMNLYDRGILTWGISQWTLHADSLQKQLRIMKQERPMLFKRLFQDRGVDVGTHPMEILFNGTFCRTREDIRLAIKGDRNGRERNDYTPWTESMFQRMEHWAKLFCDAARDPECQVYQRELAVRQYKNDILNGSIDAWTMENGYGRVSRYANRNLLLQSMLCGLYVNNPVGSMKVMARTIDHFRSENGGQTDPVRWAPGWQSRIGHKYIEMAAIVGPERRLMEWPRRIMKQKNAYDLVVASREIVGISETFL